MKRTIIYAILLLCTISCTIKKDLNIKMDYLLNWNTDRLQVQLTYYPSLPDSTTLLYGDIAYGGQADIFSCIHNITAENCTILPDSASRSIKLLYQGRPELHISYEIAYDLGNTNLNCPRELFRPNTDTTFLYVQGLNLYLREAGEMEYLQRVTWKNTPPFPTFCMYSHFADTILTKERATTVAHEIGHNWISGEQWFGEGFNDLQTWHILTASGLRTIDDYVAELNSYISSLHKSKIRNIPNSEIAGNFWKLGDYSWIIYWRGAVYGFRLLGQIEAATGRPGAFRELMLAIGKENASNMTREPFINAASLFLNRQLLEEEFDKYIINGESMDLTTTPLPSGCAIHYTPHNTPQIQITDREAFARHFSLSEQRPNPPLSL